MLNQAEEFISQDLVSIISQVIKKLNEKEEENGKVLFAYQIFEKYYQPLTWLG